MGRQKDRGMKEKADRRMGGQKDGRTEGWVDRRMGALANGWTEEWASSIGGEQESKADMECGDEAEISVT